MILTTDLSFKSSIESVNPWRKKASKLLRKIKNMKDAESSSA